MLGPQTEVEIRIWCDEVARMRRAHDTHDSLGCADDLLHAYRARYGLPQPAADDRLGKAAIETMDAIMGAMREEWGDDEMLTHIETAVQHYMGERWAITRETGK